MGNLGGDQTGPLKQTFEVSANDLLGSVDCTRMPSCFMLNVGQHPFRDPLVLGTRVNRVLVRESQDTTEP